MRYACVRATQIIVGYLTGISLYRMSSQAAKRKNQHIPCDLANKRIWSNPQLLLSQKKIYRDRIEYCMQLKKIAIWYDEERVENKGMTVDCVFNSVLLVERSPIFAHAAFNCHSEMASVVRVLSTWLQFQFLAAICNKSANTAITTANTHCDQLSV